MQPNEVRDGFLALHGEATHLLAELLRRRSGWAGMVQPWQLRKLQARFAVLSRRFDALDSQLVRHLTLPKDYDAFRTTATFDFYGAVREAVRTTLSDIEAALASRRIHGDRHRSVAVSVIAVLVIVALAAVLAVLAF